MIVGYKLVDASNNVVESWGGIWGQTPGVPDMIRLPNGDHVHCPELNTDYSGYRLIEWDMADPGPSVPESVSPRQVRLLLLQMNMLDQVEAMIAQRDRATQITWQYALEFRRDNPKLNELAVDLGLTNQQIDDFFIAAAAL